MMLLTANSYLQATTPGLLQLATTINRERDILVEYAAKPNPNKIHLERRNIFLQSLTNSYNLLYQELKSSSSLRLIDKWLLVERELSTLLADTTMDGVYIKLKISSGDNYGFINL